ncbi:MAG: SsrA-binding protein SmpB [Bacteroidales bacterium]|nr:SsrA-binding protein SmpB [Bacteroidales bacterium]HOK98268.1 SsrA-binding protein SmpB [Bacteroidales bacterium]HPO65176.1 SsrA-binding protein SmpB [Bacteroidales bacterium]
MSRSTASVEIKNKKASFEYEFLERYTAGIKLTGTEIKSIRAGKANLVDAYCYFEKGELYVKGLHIAEYEWGNLNNHDPRRVRKLLLTKKELNKLYRRSQEKGLTIIAYRLWINERGWAKLDIALARGKKQYDKREDIKKKDLQREMDRHFKI